MTKSNSLYAFALATIFFFLPLVQSGSRAWGAAKPPTSRGIALIIGNSKYENFEDLPAAANDAKAMAKIMDQLGFETRLVEDANLVSLSLALHKLVDDGKAKKIENLFLFYAGHGFQVDGSNYLAGTDLAEEFVRKEGEHKYYRLENKFNLTKFMDKLVTASKVRVLFLDACRTALGASRKTSAPGIIAGDENVGDDRSAAKKIKVARRGLTRAIRGKRYIGYSNGFGRMNAKVGTFVTYSAAPGQAANDSLAGALNSPFTTSVLKHITQPNLRIDDLVMTVRNDVLNDTSGLVGDDVQVNQTVLSETSLRRPFFFVDAGFQKWIAEQMQTELKTRGCYSKTIDGDWGSGSKRALRRFNKTNRKSFPVDIPSAGLLDELRALQNAKNCPPEPVRTIVRKTSGGSSSRRNSGGSSSGKSNSGGSRRSSSSTRSNSGGGSSGGGLPPGLGAGIGAGGF